MLCLLTNNDIYIDDKGEILHEVARFYKNLFQTMRDSDEVQVARRELLQHTSARVTNKQHREIERVLDGEEVQKVLQSMSKGKAPGMDGMSAEVLLANWNFIRADYIAMIQNFGNNRVLAYTTKTGVMKLVPKKDDKQRLKDWRPLTMLSIVYKLASKLLAIWLSPHCKHIISSQQTGFIPRHFILENVSIA